MYSVFYPRAFLGMGFYFKTISMNYIAVPTQMIYDTPNDMELGAKVRELYFELNLGTEEAERKQSCRQETESKSTTSHL